MNMDVALDSSSSSTKQPVPGLGDAVLTGAESSLKMVLTIEPTKISDRPKSVSAEPLPQKQVLVDGGGARLTETENVATDVTILQPSGQYVVSQSECGQMASASGNLVSEPHDAEMHLVQQDSETAQQGALNPGEESGRERKTPRQSRKRASSDSLPANKRVLRSRSLEKSKDRELKDEVAEDVSVEVKTRKQRKKKLTEKMPVNEFSRIKSHLRYLLHRIKYEQNFIDAYSGEGWKGQSLEKIKPEKELQRAKSQIFRYKLKTRDLFQRIDTSLAEGKLPEILFDEEGEIDSEDIFCAKCGSKDLTLDNDIILCDGACERGFHQFCLEPPLLKEDIPPGDEGWLCPGCDCKVDCMAMLSDFQGVTYSVVDQWEKVFPEEAAAAASGGMKSDDYSGLPSDESEDDDYNPDKPEQDQGDSGGESNSDGSESSDYYSACDDHVAKLDDKQIEGLPSDDSEDDDFDPNAPDKSDQSKQESSNSDFTSDSDAENLNAMSDGEESQGKKPICTPTEQSLPKVGKAKKNSLKDEVAHLLQTTDAPITAKRRVERLDYQKLHKETYGDTSSDSSDEDFSETDGEKKRKTRSRKDSAPKKIHDVDVKDGSHSQTLSDKTPNQKSNKKLQVDSSTGLAESESSPADGGSHGRNRRLEEGVKKRLYESYMQNQYPKADAKESLAKELGITTQQVSKWFENARHSARKNAGSSSANGTSSARSDGKAPEANPKGPEITAPSQATPQKEEGCSAEEPEAKLPSASSTKSRKRKNAMSDEKTPQQDSSVRRSSRRLQTSTSS